jgi:hypothetical protein
MLLVVWLIVCLAVCLVDPVDLVGLVGCLAGCLADFLAGSSLSRRS